jgi:hypothetical protein
MERCLYIAEIESKEFEQFAIAILSVRPLLLGPSLFEMECP